MEHLDLSQWNIPAPYYSQTVGYVELVQEVRDFAEYLAGKLEDVPLWQDDWPIARPDPDPPVPIPVPRL